MSRFVLDTSVAASWFFEDEGGDYSSVVLESLNNAEAFVPSLWPLEITNVLIIAERRKRCSEAEAARFIELLEHPDAFRRTHLPGHITGSAFIVSNDLTQTLLVHHAKLNRWLQPGGHAESGEWEGEAVALREAREETGIEGLALHASAPRPLDVDVHPIPARGDEPAHRHLDLRYLVVAPRDASLRRLAAEARALRWFTWEDLATLDLDPGLRRALRAARALMPFAPTPHAQEESDR